MKKYIFFLLCLLLLVGCQNSDTKQENMFKDNYEKYKQKLVNQDIFEEETDDFRIQLIINNIEDGNIRYDVVVDQPQIEMRNIKMLAYVESDESTQDVSLGILEDQQFSLIPGTVDKSQGIYKGVNLSGITSLQQFDVKILITYQNEKTIERYFILHGDATR